MTIENQSFSLSDITFKIVFKITRVYRLPACSTDTFCFQTNKKININEQLSLFGEVLHILFK